MAFAFYQQHHSYQTGLRICTSRIAKWTIYQGFKFRLEKTKTTIFLFKKKKYWKSKVSIRLTDTFSCFLLKKIPCTWICISRWIFISPNANCNKYGRGVYVSLIFVFKFHTKKQLANFKGRSNDQPRFQSCGISSMFAVIFSSSLASGICFWWLVYITGSWLEI